MLEHWSSTCIVEPMVLTQYSDGVSVCWVRLILHSDRLYDVYCSCAVLFYVVFQVVLRFFVVVVVVAADTE